VFGRVLRREDDRGAPRPPGAAEGEGAVVADLGDRPAVAVADPPGRAQAAVVAAGDDGIPDRGAGAVVQLDLAAGVHGAVEDQIGPRPLVERWTDSFESVTSTLARPASVGRQAV
jgi:hypothetical protein